MAAVHDLYELFPQEQKKARIHSKTGLLKRIVGRT